MTARTRVDPIDGPERYCRQCDAWWPDDAEFWYAIRRTCRPHEVRCKACSQEIARRYRERHPERVAAASREYRRRNPKAHRPYDPKRDRERFRLYQRERRARLKAQFYDEASRRETIAA